MLHFFRSLKTGKHFISNWYGGGIWYEVGDLIGLSKDEFEKNGLNIILTQLRKNQKPLPPDDKISHKDIRYKTRGMKEVTISLTENEEIKIYPVRGNDNPKEGGTSISSTCNIDEFFKTLENVYENSRRSL